MIVSRWNPWSEVLSANGQAEHLVNETFDRATMPERMVRALPLDIRETGDAFRIEASVPGFRPEDVEITFDENVLTIRGLRRRDDETARGEYVKRERHLSSVYRQVYLPTQVKPDDITASFDNGVLTIMVPREQKAQPKRIPVSTTPTAEPKLIESSVAAVAAASA